MKSTDDTKTGPKVSFRKINSANIEDRKWLRYMDAEIFPNDIPFEFHNAEWFIGFANNTGNAVAYCGWKPFQHGPKHGSYLVGLHYRAGVMENYRGLGLQKEMIKLREMDMQSNNIFIATTYTEVYSAASMRSFISAGYRPYEATDYTALTGLDRYKRFVHWRKDLGPLMIHVNDITPW